MKKIIKLTCAILIISMLFVIPVRAMKYEVQRASAFFLSSSTYLYKTSSTEFDICFEITATGTMTELGARIIKLQRSSDGVNWSTIETYTRDDYPDMITQNTGCHGYSKSYTAEKGYYYREYIEYYAKDSSGSGTMFEYSSKLKL